MPVAKPGKKTTSVGYCIPCQTGSRWFWLEEGRCLSLQWIAVATENANQYPQHFLPLPYYFYQKQVKNRIQTALYFLFHRNFKLSKPRRVGLRSILNAVSTLSLYI